ncbi:MAG: hypothetical protein ABSD31_21885 [Candidatus Binataceae bacterium]|jgi:hypothetical protein
MAGIASTNHMRTNTPQQTKGQADTLAAALDAAYEAADEAAFPYCDDYEPHDPATCPHCHLREARSAYRAAARAPVLARLKLLDDIVLEDIPKENPTALVDRRRRRRDRARIAYEQAAATGTPRQQVDAAAALELAECEFEIVYAKSLAGYVYEQRDGFFEAFKRRSAELEELDFIIPQAEYEWRLEYLKQEKAMWLAAHASKWRLDCRAYVERYGSQFAKDNFGLVMLMVGDRRGWTIGRFTDYLEGLKSKERFHRWAKRRCEECVQ